MATIRCRQQEASRFGILDVDKDYSVKSFIEKPPQPPSNLANMGVYLFNSEVLDRVLWEDHLNDGLLARLWQGHHPAHDPGRGHVSLPFPYSGYWVDVGTHPLLLAGAHGPAGHTPPRST